MMKRAAIVLAVFALAGCVAPSGNGVLRSSADLPPNARIVASSSSEALHAATEAALTRLGYRFGPVGEFSLDTAYSARPLTVSFETDGGLHSGPARLPNLALCGQEIQRLTLVITELRTGRPAYQGQAEITQCAGAVSDNARRLANAAVAKLQPPLAAR
jgi:hypothetical protein